MSIESPSKSGRAATRSASRAIVLTIAMLAMAGFHAGLDRDLGHDALHVGLEVVRLLHEAGRCIVGSRLDERLDLGHGRRGRPCQRLDRASHGPAANAGAGRTADPRNLPEPAGGIDREFSTRYFREAGEVVPAPQHVVDRLQDLGGSREGFALAEPTWDVTTKRLLLYGRVADVDTADLAVHAAARGGTAATSTARRAASPRRSRRSPRFRTPSRSRSWAGRSRPASASRSSTTRCSGASWPSRSSTGR